jgi:hypothetical protein
MFSFTVYSAQGGSSVALSGGISYGLFGVYDIPPGLLLSVHRHESAAKYPGALAIVPILRERWAAGGDERAVGGQGACREQFTTSIPGCFCESWACRLLFLPLLDGAGRAPYAMPRCDTGYLSNPTIWSLCRAIAACVRRRQRSH